MVAAIVAGGNVTVPTGKTVGPPSRSCLSAPQPN